MIANALDGSAAITANITNSYVFCSFAETPDQVPDSVRGKIALIERGGSVNVGEPVNAGRSCSASRCALRAPDQPHPSVVRPRCRAALCRSDAGGTTRMRVDPR